MAATGYADVVSVKPWELAEQYAGLSNPAALVPYPGSGAITLASGTYQNYTFTCSSLILPNNNTKLVNCRILCSDASYGVRLDANTGEEVGRYLEHCEITATGVALAGAGFTARLCKVVNNGDDSARIGRSHAEPTILELCRFSDFRPNPAAHADGCQVVTEPAADVILYGCSISMNTAAGYTLPSDAGYTGALFVAFDVPVVGGDPEPTRFGGVWASHCKLVSSQNYTLVIDEQKVDIRDCVLLPGTTAVESINNGVTVTGAGNVDGTGAPIVDTNIHGDPRTRFLTVGDPRQSGGGASTFAGLTDVNVAGVTNGQIPAWNATDSKWEPASQSSGGGGAARMAIVSGFITSGVTLSADTGGAWLPVAGTNKSIAAIAGDQVAAEYGFSVNNSGSTFYDVGVVVAGSLVRMLYSSEFPPDAGYEGMAEFVPDNPAQFIGSHNIPWFTAQSGDVSGGNVTFCVCHKGAGALLDQVALPMRYALYNNHQ